MTRCIKGDDGLILAAGYSFHVLQPKIYGLSFWLKVKVPDTQLQEATNCTYIITLPIWNCYLIYFGAFHKVIKVQMSAFITWVTWNHGAHPPRPHTRGWSWKRRRQSAHMQRHARERKCVFSHIGPGIPSPQPGRQKWFSQLPLDECAALLQWNERLHGRKYEAPEAEELRRQVISAILHAAPRSSPPLRRQMNLFFYGCSIVRCRR